MKRQPITTEVINSYQQSLFLIKANLKVNESASELMQYVKNAETFLELFLKLPTLPKSLDLLDLVEFFIETKHTELEHFVCDVSSLRYPVNQDTSTTVTGKSKLLLNTITMLFHYPEGFDLDFSGSYIESLSGMKISMRYKHHEAKLIVYKDPEALDLEYYVEEWTSEKTEFEFSDVQRLEVFFNEDGELVIETVQAQKEITYKNNLTKLLKISQIKWLMTRKQRVIKNNYNDFEAYAEFKLSNRADIS